MRNHCIHPVPAMCKEEIRQVMIRRRSNMATQERGEASKIIGNLILKSWRRTWNTVLIYVHRDDEVETIPIIRRLIRLRRKLCVPAFDRPTNRYYPSELKNFEREMESSGFGILEPKPSARHPVPIRDIDVIFLPGLAFDDRGNRLGYGYGYFDRICRFARAFKIGLAYDFQRVDALPIEEEDVPVDQIITEKGITECRR